MKYWIKGKYRQLLVLLGLRIDGEWFLLRELHRVCGKEDATALYAGGIILDLKYNGLPTKKRFQKIVSVTELKSGD